MKAFHSARFFRGMLPCLLFCLMCCESSDEPAVDVTGIELETCYPSMTVGEQKQLVALVRPVNASVKSYKWTSSDKSVATVTDAGQVTAIAAGTVSLTATTTNGIHSVTCTVEVNDVLKQCFVRTYEAIGADLKKSVGVYVYDENNKLIEYEVTRDLFVYTTTYIYEGELIVSQITTSNAGDTFVRDFQYDDQGRVIKDIYPKENTLVYSYNENGLLSRVDGYFYNKTNSQYDKLYTVRKLTYSSPSSKNPQKIDEYDASGAWSATFEYEYDNMKNPMFELKLATGTVFPNNVVKQTLTQANVTPSSTSNTFQYNGLGYPTTVIVAGATTYNYTYECK